MNNNRGITNNKLATNNGVEMGAIAHEQSWRAEVDQPTLARVKCLVISELTITTLSAHVFIMRHQISCCRFHSLPAGSLVPFWNPKNPPAALLLHNNHLVQYQTNSIIKRTVSWEKPGYHGFLLCARETFCIKTRGSPWLSPLSSDGSWDDQAGEAGTIEP
jgi:hypothetical protein